LSYPYSFHQPSLSLDLDYVAILIIANPAVSFIYRYLEILYKYDVFIYLTNIKKLNKDRKVFIITYHLFEIEICLNHFFRKITIQVMSSITSSFYRLE
jgi:hypothetical protein